MNYKIKSRIWIESDQNIFLGEGRIKLLKAINEQGSLSKAAKSLNMSYKKAWIMVTTINENAKKTVVETSVGGKNGGGAKVTTYGKLLIITFDEINNKCWKYLDKQIEKINQL